jgi:hypothetical protein
MESSPLLVKSFPKTLRTWSEASGSANLISRKQNKLPSFIDKLVEKGWSLGPKITLVHSQYKSTCRCKKNLHSFAICSISFHLVMLKRISTRLPFAPFLFTLSCFARVMSTPEHVKHQHKKHTLIMEGLTKSNFPLTWERNSARHPAKNLQFFLAFSLFGHLNFDTMQPHVLRMLSPKGFTVCKAQQMNILNLRSSSSSWGKNFRGYKCFMCWAWPSDSGIYEDNGLPEARSEAAPYSQNSERGLYLTHDMSGGMLHTLSTRAMCPKTIFKLVLCLTRWRYWFTNQQKKIALIS